MCSKMVEFERYRAISLLYAMERGWEGEEKGKRGGVKGGGEERVMEGEGQQRGKGWKGRGSRVEREGRGGERDGAIICRNDCRKYWYVF